MGSHVPVESLAGRKVPATFCTFKIWHNRTSFAATDVPGSNHKPVLEITDIGKYTVNYSAFCAVSHIATATNHRVIASVH